MFRAPLRGTRAPGGRGVVFCTKRETYFLGLCFGAVVNYNVSSLSPSSGFTSHFTTALTTSQMNHISVGSSRSALLCQKWVCTTASLLVILQQYLLQAKLITSLWAARALHYVVRSECVVQTLLLQSFLLLSLLLQCFSCRPFTSVFTTVFLHAYNRDTAGIGHLQIWLSIDISKPVQMYTLQRAL